MSLFLEGRAMGLHLLQWLKIDVDPKLMYEQHLPVWMKSVKSGKVEARDEEADSDDELNADDSDKPSASHIKVTRQLIASSLEEIINAEMGTKIPSFNDPCVLSTSSEEEQPAGVSEESFYIKTCKLTSEGKCCYL